MAALLHNLTAWADDTSAQMITRGNAAYPQLKLFQMEDRIPSEDHFFGAAVCVALLTSIPSPVDRNYHWTGNDARSKEI